MTIYGTTYSYKVKNQRKNKIIELELPFFYLLLLLMASMIHVLPSDLVYVDLKEYCSLAKPVLYCSGIKHFAN